MPRPPLSAISVAAEPLFNRRRQSANRKPAQPRPKVINDVPRLLVDEAGWAYRVIGTASNDADGYLSVQPLHPLRNLRHRLRQRFGLTEREVDIVLLLGRRSTNREIGDELGISLHTVRHHTERVLEKTRLKSRAEVRRFLVETLTDITDDPEINDVQLTHDGGLSA